jgi:acetylglutamate kinase
MEKVTKGLALEELEAQHVELLPDRIEMRRRRSTVRRIRRGNINCDQQAIAVLAGVAVNGAQTCFNINA